jgi:hypothetical protein
MNFFKKLNDKKLPNRYPENTQGDFYVENEVCITCGAPESVAPDLIEHSKLEYGHCYFKKQPKSHDEIERAISAMDVSCIAGLRYGGTDENILKRIYEKGLEDLCDNKPIRKYKMIVWSKVTFNYAGTMQELSNSITTEITKTIPYINKQIVNYKTNNKDHFEFIYRWTEGLTGTIFKVNFKNDGQCKVELMKEKRSHLVSIRNNAFFFNLILCNNTNVTEILWYDLDNNLYNESQIK